MKTLFLTSLMMTLALTAQAAELSARDILAKVDENQLATTDSAFSQMQLTSCKFGLKGGKMSCVEQPRIKLLESVQLNSGDNNKDTKSLMVVLEPAAERGVGMLSYSYDDEAIANEAWLYLSALGKVKRIAADVDDEAEPQSLFGSEFTTEDQETGKLDDYQYQIIAEEDYKDRPVWVIEATPNELRAKTSRYSKTVSWVDKERFIVLKSSAYDKKDIEIKRFNMDNIEQINGVWMARSITVLNLVSSRLSNINQKAITFGVAIDDDFLTTRALTDKVFREQGLNALRAQTK